MVPENFVYLYSGPYCKIDSFSDGKSIICFAEAHLSMGV